MNAVCSHTAIPTQYQKTHIASSFQFINLNLLEEANCKEFFFFNPPLVPSPPQTSFFHTLTEKQRHIADLTHNYKTLLSYCKSIDTSTETTAEKTDKVPLS